MKGVVVRILIADDDTTSRTVLTGVLERGGHEVVATVDGIESWQVLQQDDAPLLVILDWMMPGMDGLEVVRRVRALRGESRPYVIMLTAKGEKADIVAGLAAGANDYLSKPFDACELRARVDVGRRMLEMQEELTSKIEELNRALVQIRTLRGIVPICAGCKKIRDDAGYWQQVEDHIGTRTEAEFSHGLCPACIKRPYPDPPQG